MALVIFDCPHCFARKMTSTVRATYLYPEEAMEFGQSPRADISTVCNGCFTAIGIRVTNDSYRKAVDHYTFGQKLSVALKSDATLNSTGFTCAVVRTPRQESRMPRHLSPAVTKALKSAEQNLQLEDGEDAAATMFRRAIDVAIREKHPEVSGMLKLRIDKLNKKGLIPDAMKDWTDEIRLIGNDGAHEPEGVSRPELLALQAFTDAFLRYYVSLPFEVSLRRGKIDEQGNPVDGQDPNTADTPE